MRTFLLGVVGAILFATAPASAQKYNLTLAGASPGGLWSTIGVGMDKALSKAYPGSAVTYQTSSGGLANAKLVNDGKVPMGITADMELNAAWNGKGPFRGHPQKNLRVLLRTYAPSSRFQMMHALINGDVAKKYGIRTFKDLKRNARHLRIAVNRPGNMDGDMGIAILRIHGIRLSNLKQAVRAASREQVSLMLDRRIDGQIYGIAYNHPRIREVANKLPLVMLDVGKAESAELATEFGGEPCIVKANEYKFISEDKTTVCVGTVIVVNKSMPEKTAYDIVRGVLKNIDDFKSAHRLLKKVTTPQSLAGPASVPHHPGAIRAFKEAGLM